jgi:hypothetical protein
MSEEENTPWQYKHDGQQASGQSALNQTTQEEPAEQQDESSATASLSWTGPEYVEHERAPSWYFLLILAILTITTALYFLTKDIFAVVATVIAGIILGVYAGRKPHQVTYELTDKGLKIGQKLYPYNAFRSFSIFQEGTFSSINFLPVKRLMPPIAAYFDPQNEQKVEDAVGNHLPLDQHKLDAIDRLSRRLRF